MKKLANFLKYYHFSLRSWKCFICGAVVRHGGADLSASYEISYCQIGIVVEEFRRRWKVASQIQRELENVEEGKESSGA